MEACTCPVALSTTRRPRWARPADTRMLGDVDTRKTPRMLLPLPTPLTPPLHQCCYHDPIANDDADTNAAIANPWLPHARIPINLQFFANPLINAFRLVLTVSEEVRLKENNILGIQEAVVVKLSSTEDDVVAGISAIFVSQSLPQRVRSAETDTCVR